MGQVTTKLLTAGVNSGSQLKPIKNNRSHSMRFEKFFLCAITLISGVIINADNMINDSSFELGIDKATTGNLFKWKKGDAFHGVHYAVLRGKSAFFRSKKLLDIPQKYTFSVYMRSPENGAKAVLRMGEGRWKAAKKTINLTPQWKRYSLTAELKQYKADDLGKNHIYGCWIENPSDSDIDVDCAQWEEGQMTPYSPRNKPEVGISSSKYANIFFDNDELKFSIGITKSIQKQENFLCKITVFDAFDAQVAKKEMHFKNINNSDCKDFSFTAPKYGFFKIKATLYNAEMQPVDSHEIHAARISSMDDGKFHPESFFGLTARPNSTDPEIMQKQWKLVTGTGAKWNRVFINWRTAEPQKGVYKWNAFFKDQTIKEGYIKKMCQLVVMSGFFNRGTPKWALNEETTRKAGFNVPKEKEMYEFLTQTIERYKKEVSIWSLQNEPYLMVDGGASKLSEASKKKFLDWIFELHKNLYFFFKKLDPDSLVIANINGKGQLENNSIYAQTMQDKGMMNFIDGVSWHFYRGKFPPEIFNTIPLTIRKTKNDIKNKVKRKTPLNFYQTESSTCSNDLFDDDNNHYGEYSNMMNPASFGYNESELDAAANAIRTTIIEISEGIKISFWFLVGSYSDYKAYNLHSMIKDHWRSPKIIYPAHNAMTRIIDETKPLGQLNLNKKIRAYGFKKGNDAVIPYWHLMLGKNQGKISLEPNTPIKYIYDFMGNKIEIKRNSETMALPLGNTPNYIVCNIKDIADIESSLKNGKVLDFKGKTIVTVAIVSGSITPEVATVIQNNSSDDISGKIRITKTPKGLILKKEKLAFGPIAGMTSSVQKYPTTSFEASNKGKIAGIAMADGKMIEFQRDAAIFISDNAPSEKIKIDGKDNDWNLKNTPIEIDSTKFILNPKEKEKQLWNGKNDLSAKIWSCWDKNNLYFLIKVKDNAVVQDSKKPFMGDCVQLFFDCDTLGDMGNIHFNKDDIQFCLTPHDEKNKTRVAIISKNKKIKKDNLRIVSAKTDDGYIIEVCFPAETLLHKAFKSGTALGFNVAVDDRDTPGEGLRRKYEMIWTGKDNKMWAYTDRLGFIILNGKSIK
jgi:cellulose/xylan binding protein with CBM9 domain